MLQWMLQWKLQQCLELVGYLIPEWAPSVMTVHAQAMGHMEVMSWAMESSAVPVRSRSVSRLRRPGRGPVAHDQALGSLPGCQALPG